MPAIATLEEFASSLQRDLDTASATLYLLDLAQGLITEEIGERDPWPATAKAVALAAATRAYRNPEGLRREGVGQVLSEYGPEEVGVYLTEQERARLQRWLARQDDAVNAGPHWSFPAPSYPFPDAVERLPLTTVV